jgi:hypothetical protein
MKPAPFTYHRASSAAETVEMLAAAGDDASVLAGGQSLVPLINFRVALPAHLVDINHVDELDYIRTDDGALAIGARTRQAAVERSEDGHIVGGVAQGIGTALFEEYVYGEDGNLLAQSYTDYLIPTSMEVPEITIGHCETPSPWTPHGIKGGGEGGRMMAPAVVASAIDDALPPLAVRATVLPATPERVVD